MLLQRLEHLVDIITRMSKALLALSVIFVILLLLYKIIYFSIHPVVIISPFDVPESLADKGVSGQVAAETLKEQLQAIQQDASTKLSGKFREAGLRPGRSDLLGTPFLQEIKIPGTSLSPDRFADLILGLIGRSPLDVSGRFTESTDASMNLVIRISGSVRKFSSSPGVKCEGDCAEKLLQQAAEDIFALQSPFSLAIHHYPENSEKCEAVLRLCFRNNNPEDDVPAYNLWGLLLQRRGDVEAAERKFQRALSEIDRGNLDPEFKAVVYNNWGILLARQKRYEEAQQKYSMALNFDDSYSRALYNQGRAWHAQNQLFKAAQLYREAISQEPELYDAYHNLAMALQQQGKLGESIEVFAELARRTNGRYPGVYLHWGNALIKQGDCPQAIEKLYMALDAQYPKSNDAFANEIRQLRPKEPGCGLTTVPSPAQQAPKEG